ncbi:MAG: questin oxidase family protein [Pyrinomonadaceae bacterium]
MSRRRFMSQAAVAASVSWLSLGLLDGCTTMTGQNGRASTGSREGNDAMDEALSMLAKSGPEYGGGLSNHGPMAAEALVNLGRPAAVVPWVERYKRQLQDSPVESRRAISRQDWTPALGDFSRVGDWIGFFNRELKESPWRDVLGEWSERLAPGLVAAATHGLIRTGHAARSLGQKETLARRRELAEGLAYWAARYQLLPAASRERVAGSLKPSQAIKKVELLPVDRRGRGLISDSLERLEGFAPFAGVADFVDSSVDAHGFISDLTETFAGVYLANAPRNTIAFIHAVTGPAAIRLLLPYLTPQAKQRLLRYGWQAAAALYAAFAGTGQESAVKIEKQEQRRDDLIERAIANGDEHAIKFTEACLREHALNPKPIYLLAARNAVDN